MSKRRAFWYFNGVGWFLSVISGVILIAGVVDDLRSKKIHNHLILFFIPLALLSVLIFKGSSSLLSMSLVSGLVSLLISIPLYSLRMIGGGDVKLYLAVSLTWGLNTTILSFVYALPISVVFGLLRTLFKGEIKQFGVNILHLIRLKKVDHQKTQTFPFSAALFLGWLTYLVLQY